MLGLGRHTDVGTMLETKLLLMLLVLCMRARVCIKVPTEY